MNSKLSALLAVCTATAFTAVRTEGCRESAVRLDGLGSRAVGRVHVCQKGEWKHVCSSGRWRESNAVVVCRELGFTSGAVLTTADRLAVSITTTAAGHSVTCSGLESSVVQCTTNQTTNCQGPPPIVMCTNSPGVGSVRLIHADSERSEVSGVVEVWTGSEWVGVCTDDWSNKDSGVVCRQLGYPTGTPTFTKPHASIIRKLPRQRVNYVHCSGAEGSLLACNTTLYISSECGTAYYASVTCSQSSMIDQDPSSDECSSVSTDVIMSFGAVQLVVVCLTILLNVIILVAWSRWRRNKTSQTSTTSSLRGGGFLPPPSYSDAGRDTLLESGGVDSTQSHTNHATPTNTND